MMMKVLIIVCVCVCVCVRVQAQLLELRTQNYQLSDDLRKNSTGRNTPLYFMMMMMMMMVVMELLSVLFVGSSSRSCSDICLQSQTSDFSDGQI